MLLTASGLGNSSVLLLPSAVRNATTLSPVFTNYMGGRIVLQLDISVVGGGGETVQLELLSVDLGVAVQVAIGTAYVGTTGKSTLIVGPGCAAAWSQTNSQQRETSPPILSQVRVIHSAAAAWTYQLNAMEIL